MRFQTALPWDTERHRERLGRPGEREEEGAFGARFRLLGPAGSATGGRNGGAWVRISRSDVLFLDLCLHILNLPKNILGLSYNIPDLPKNILSLSYNILDLPKNILGLSYNILDLPKNILSLPYNILDLPKNILGLSYNILNLPKNILSLSYNILDLFSPMRSLIRGTGSPTSSGSAMFTP